MEALTVNKVWNHQNSYGLSQNPLLYIRQSEVRNTVAEEELRNGFPENLINQTIEKCQIPRTAEKEFHRKNMILAKGIV